MKKEESRFTASNIMEGMTSISALLSAKQNGINDRIIHEIRFDEAKKAKKSREFSFLRAKCEELHIPLHTTSAEEIEALCIGNTHGGVIALCGERTLCRLTSDTLPQNAFLCFLEGIEDPYNFGYALRSLYAAGCDGVLLGERNWLSAAGVVARASAGASEALPLFVGEPRDSLSLLKETGYRVVMAGIRDSVGMYEANLQKPIVLVIGGEKRGVSREIATLADETVRIDYGREFRGSLSAASAATVLAFEVLHQNTK